MTHEEVIGMARAIGRLTNALSAVEEQLAEAQAMISRLEAENAALREEMVTQ